MVNLHPFWAYAFEHLACGIAPIGTYITNDSLYTMDRHLKIEDLSHSQREIKTSLQEHCPDMVNYFMKPAKLTKMNLIQMFVTKASRKFNLSVTQTEQLYVDLYIRISFKQVSYQMLQENLDTPEEIIQPFPKDEHIE